MAVRNERVVLTLDDQFSTQMTRAAVATALLNRNLHDLDGTSVDTADGVREVGDEVDRTGEKSKRADQSINQLTGRLALLRDAVFTLGPALVPLGAGAVGGFAGMAAQAGAAAGAVAVTVAAFDGLGDALKAVNAAQLEPTAENLAKMRLELEKIGPDAARFATYLQEIEPDLRSLQMTARAGIFPGLETGIDALLTRGPQLQSIVSNIASALGDMAEATGEGLGGDRFDAFFEYMESEADPILRELATSIGYVIEGLANLMVAFAPVSSDFSAGMEEMARSFAEWTRTLDENQGFQNFVNYVRENGPAALDFLGSLVLALASIVEAAAPIGSAVLPVLTNLLDLLSAIAGTDVGTTLLAAAAGLSAYSRAAAIAGAASQGIGGGLLASTSAVKSLRAAQDAALPTLGQFGTVLYRAGQSADDVSKKTAAARQAVAPFRAAMGQAAAGAGLLALSMTDVDEKIGLANTGMGVMAGFMVGGPWGAAIGAGIGLAADFAATNDDVTASLDRLEASLARVAGRTPSVMDGGQLSAELDAARASLIALADAVESDALTGAKSIWDDIWGETDYEEAYDRFIEAQAKADAAILASKRVRAEAAADQSYRRWLEAETAALEQNIAMMRAKRDEALRGVNSTLDYASAVLDARDALKENGRTLDMNTRAGIDNRRALAGLAAAWNGQSDAAKNADGAYKRARETLIRTATQMGMTAAQAKRYADRLMEIPPEMETRIQLESSQAMQQIKAVRSELASLRDKTITVGVRRVNAGGFGPQVGAGFASGGYTGDIDPREVAGVVHGREYVVNARATALHRPLLEKLNASVPGYASGGYVAPAAAVGMGVSIAQSQSAVFRWTDLLGMSEKAVRAELRMREKLLAQEARHAARRAEMFRDEQAKEREKLDAMTDELQAIRDAQEAFSARVAGNFSSDIFGGASLTAAYARGGLGPDFTAGLEAYVQQKAAEAVANGEPGSFSTMDMLGEYLSTLSYSDRNAAAGEAAVSQLNADRTGAASFQYLLGQLSDLGFDGAGFEQLAASGNQDFARYLISLGAGGVDSFESDFNARQAQLDSLGQFAGTEVFGLQVDAQAAAVAAQTVVLQESRDIARRAEQRAERIERRLEAFRKDFEDIKDAAGKEGPKAFAAAVNGAVSDGRRKGRG